MKKIGILWDLDGTLLDTLEDLTDGTNYTLRYYGLPERAIGEVRQFVGNGARRLVDLALPGRADDPDPALVLETFQTYYKDHCQIKTKPYDGILDALADLGREYHMAIVSNKPDIAVKPLCAQYFPGLYAQGQTAQIPRKPAPDMVHRAMDAIGVETCVYVGDSEVDVLTAKNAGVTCLSVLWGFRDRACLEANGGAHFCEDPADLRAKLEELIHGQ